MQINLEAAEEHAIQTYTDHQIQINSIIYERSLIVSRKEIITDIAITNIQELDEQYLDLLLQCKPELIIIGHNNLGSLPPMKIISQLSQKRIGMECMSIGAACRTYNILLSELRGVVAGFIF
jgi:uncharacterized protein